jgi:transposase
MDVFIGIDVSKDRLDICVRPSGETFVVTRDDQGLAVEPQEVVLG